MMYQTPQKSGFTLVSSFNIKKNQSEDSNNSPLKQNSAKQKLSLSQYQQQLQQPQQQFPAIQLQQQQLQQPQSDTKLQPYQVFSLISTSSQQSSSTISLCNHSFEHYLQENFHSGNKELKISIESEGITEQNVVLQLVISVLLASYQQYLEHLEQSLQPQHQIQTLKNLYVSALQSPSHILVSENAWKLIISIINKKSYKFNNPEEDTYFKEIQNIFLFMEEQAALAFFKLISNCRQTSLMVETINQFLEQAIEKKDNYEHITFQLFSQGSLFTVTRENFEQDLQLKNQLISNHFEKNANVIINFLNNETKQKFGKSLEELIQQYLRLISNFKRYNLANQVLETVNEIFASNSQVDKKQFLKSMKSISEKYGYNILSTYFELIQIESRFLQSQFPTSRKLSKSSSKQSKTQSPSLQPQTELNSSSSTNEENEQKQNYYLKSIDKLLNKCVFNGDASCSCKKCQCIRRNRNSAKESQKRKREALIQIGPLQEKYDQIVEKCNQLEQQNKFFRETLEILIKKIKVDTNQQNGTGQTSNNDIQINFQLLQDILSI